jgi:hypothetical protein
MKMTRGLGMAVLAALAVTASAVAGSDRATGSLALRAPLQLVSTRGGACPPGVAGTVECPSRRSTGRIAGLGTVVVLYTYLADLGHPSCPVSSVKILGYPARLTVAGKGELQLELAPHPDCLSQAGGISVTQSFTITGGTGLYAGASGSGTVSRSLSQTDTGAAGRETWTGSLTVPELEFDLVRPVLAGATSRVVRAARGAKTARVAFEVTARDDRDGARPATCAPKSGARFKLGRTRVSCSATDGSGNTATAAFTITVKARR